MEYWVHEVYLIPCSDFRLIHHHMLVPEKMGWKYRNAWVQEHEAEIAQSIRHIRDKGSMHPVDFGYPHKGAGGWWEWKPYKWHLKGLFIVGKVIVAERRNL